MDILLLALAFVSGAFFVWHGLRLRKKPALDRQGKPLPPERARLSMWINIAIGVAVMLPTGSLLLIFLLGD